MLETQRERERKRERERERERERVRDRQFKSDPWVSQAKALFGGKPVTGESL